MNSLLSLLASGGDLVSSSSLLPGVNGTLFGPLILGENGGLDGGGPGGPNRLLPY